MELDTSIKLEELLNAIRRFENGVEEEEANIVSCMSEEAIREYRKWTDNVRKTTGKIKDTITVLQTVT